MILTPREMEIESDMQDAPQAKVDPDVEDLMNGPVKVLVAPIFVGGSVLLTLSFPGKERQAGRREGGWQIQGALHLRR